MKRRHSYAARLDHNEAMCAQPSTYTGIISGSRGEAPAGGCKGGAAAPLLLAAQAHGGDLVITSFRGPGAKPRPRFARGRGHPFAARRVGARRRVMSSKR